jgi:Domain of unknown function (DUF3459)
MAGNSATYEVLGEGAVSVRWTMGDGTRLGLVANLAGRRLENVRSSGRRIWSIGTGDRDTLGRWGVIWTIEGRSDLDR